MSLAKKKGRGPDLKKRAMSKKSLANLQYNNRHANVCSYMVTYDPKLILPPRQTWFCDDDRPTDPYHHDPATYGAFENMAAVYELGNAEQESCDAMFKREEIRAFHTMLKESGQLSQAATFFHAVAKELGCQPSEEQIFWELSPTRRSIHCHFLLTKKCIGTRECFRIGATASATRACRLAKRLNPKFGLFATVNVKVYKEENHDATASHKYLTKGEKSGLYYKQARV